MFTLEAIFLSHRLPDARARRTAPETSALPEGKIRQNKKMSLVTSAPARGIGAIVKKFQFFLETC